jgi:hypothetical protein
MLLTPIILNAHSSLNPIPHKTNRTRQSTSGKAATALSPAAWRSLSESNGALDRGPVPWPVLEDTYNSKTNALFIANSHEMWVSAADEPQHDQNNRDNQENVNEPSHRRRGHQAQQPENDEDDGYSF